MTITRVRGYCSRIRLNSSMPPKALIFRSVTTTSKGVSAILSNASYPFKAWAVRQSSLERIFSQFLQIWISSSTIRTLGISIVMILILTKGEGDREPGSLTGLAINRNGPTVLGNNAAGNGKAQTGATFLCGKKWIKNLVLEVF